MALNKKDQKERKKLIKEANAIREVRNILSFFHTSLDIYSYFHVHYEEVMEKIKELDAKSLRDSLSKTNPYYKSSR